MKKAFLGGASALALVALSSAASAQGVDVILGPNLLSTFDEGIYINAAVNAAEVDGSVNIDAVGLLGAPGLGSADLSVQGSVAAAVAVGDIDVGLGVPGGLEVGVDGLALAAAGAAQIDVELVGNRISSTAEIATTAIGAVNEGTIGIGVDSVDLYSDESSVDDFGGLVSFEQTEESFGGLYSAEVQVASSAANTSNTAAAAFASNSDIFAIGPSTNIETDLFAIGPSTDIDTDIFSYEASGPMNEVFAANVAVNLAEVDGSVNLSGAAYNDIAGTATTAIGAVNTGTITNGLPGSVTIVVGGDE